MPFVSPWKAFRPVAILLPLLLVPATSRAAISDFHVLLNVDVNPNTGCDVPTPDGVFRGVEHVLVTTVETSVSSGQITRVERRECVNEATDTFGAPVLVSNGGWPVGVGLGLDGSDVVETTVPVAEVGGEGPPPVIRLGLVGASGEVEDALLVARPATGQPILLNLVAALEIPTLSEWTLILFALLLAALAFRRLKPHRVTAVVCLVLLATAGIAWASVQDGLIDDWVGIAPLAEDPEADVSGGADLRALFARGENGEICLRIDAFLPFEPPNEIPEADDQAVTTDEDTPVVITLTGSDGDGDGLTFAIGTGPANGTLGAITPIDATSAQVTYTPDADFNGSDGFTFTVNDGTVDSAPAMVDITVDPINDAPVADAQMVTTDEDTPVVITLTGSDVDGDSLTFAVATGPTNGTLGAITPIDATSAQVTYTPDLDFNGSDGFTFTANDGTVDSAAATVSITVDAGNDAPVADAQMVTTDEDTPVVITLTGSDVDGDGLTFAVATGPTNGALGAITPINATSAQVTYTPNADFNGSDGFTFTVNDGTVDSAAATVSITVDAGNDAPVADAQMVTTDEDTPVVITLTGSDVDGDGLTFAVATGPTSGTLGAITPIDATSAQVTYTPNADFNGSDNFTFTVDDGTISSAAATVSITVNAVQDPPTANAQMVTTDEDTPVVITLTGADVDGDGLTFAVDTGPTNGTLGAITPIDATSAQVTYTPNANFHGADSFTFTVHDGTATSAPAMVSITVDAVNDVPLADDQAVSTDEEVPVVITLTGSDVDGDGLTFAVATGPTNGTLGAITPIDATSAQVTYTPNADFNGSDGFTFTVNDGTVGSAAATVSITVDAVNDPPMANPQMVMTDEDMAVVITLTGTDVDGDSLTFAVATGPSNGGLSAITPIDATSAQVTYTPNANFFGADGFTFTVNDGTVSSGPAMVDVTVNAVPDPPLAGNDAFSTVGNVELVVAEMDDASMPSGPAFVSATGNVLANDSDPVEGTPITLVELQGDTSAPFTGTTTQGGSVTLLADGSFVYTPEAGDRNLVDSFTYVIQNGVGAQATGTVEITIVDELLWFVKNTDSGGNLRAAGLGDGTSSDPFSSLSDPGTMNDAEDVSVAGESILVFRGDGTAANQDQGITLEDNQKLFGHSTATLMLGGITVQTPAPGARPKIDNVNAGGDGVTITDVTGVEVTGLDISGTDNAVQIRSTIAGTFTAGIHDNTISDAGGHGIDGRTTAGQLRLALDDNTGITAGGSGVLLDGTGGGSLFVTSFGGNEIAGATAADGLFANDVVFDADPSTPTFEEVVAGATVIGTSGDPVTGDGLKLTAVKGDLHFTQLDVFNTGGVAIQVVADTSGGTGFELSNAAGQVESVGDSHGIVMNAVDIDSGEGFTFDRIVSTGSTRGVELLGVDGGAFSIVDGGAASSLTSTGEAIRVEGGNAPVTFSGVSAVRTTAGGAAILGFNHDGLFTMTAGTITHTGGRAVDFDDMDGGSDFTGTTVSTTNHHGKRLVNSAGTHTLPAVVVTTAPPAGVDALHLENNTGTTNVAGLSVTTNGSRGLFAGNAGTLNLTGGTNQVTTTGHSAVEMSNTTIGGSGVTFASISASNTGANEGLDLDGVSGAAFQVTGTVTVNTTTTGAAGIDVASSAAPVTINAVDVDATAGAGIALTSNSGTVTINGGDVNAAAGVAFDVNGGSGNVTYGGTIRNTTDNAVEVTGRATAGRTVTLSGNITHDNGAGLATNHIGIEVTGNTAGSTVFSGAAKTIKSGTQNGVHLVNNMGHTVQFTTGGLDVDTTSGIGFNATGGGTVEATGAGSSITSTTGTALNLVTTGIGPGHLSFGSVSSNGASSGIVLNGNTGSTGRLIVGPTVGGACDSVATCAGGAIQNSTGAAISLTNTRNVSFTELYILNGASHGISGTTMADATGGVHPTFELRNSFLESPGDGDNESAIYFDSPGVANITGRMVVSDTTIQNFEDVGVHVGNNSGTVTIDLTNLTIDNNSDVNGEEGVDVEAQGTANMTLNMTGGTYSDLEGGGVNAFISSGSGVIDVNINGVTITGTGGPDNFPTPPAITLSAEGGSSTLTFDITNNDILDSSGDGIFVGHEGTISGRITGNDVSGLATGDGLRIDTDATGSNTVTILVDGNNFGNVAGSTGIGDDGIQVLHRDGTKVLNLTVTNNQIKNTNSEGIRYFTDDDVAGGGPGNVLRISDNQFGSNGLVDLSDSIVIIAQDPGTEVCANVTGNTTVEGITLQQSVSAVLQITQASTAVLSAANGGATVTPTGTITFNGTCTTPPQPMNP